MERITGGCYIGECMVRTNDEAHRGRAPRRRSRRLAVAGLLFGGLLTGAQGAYAGVIFADDFDAEPGSGEGTSGLSGTNYTGFANWTIAGGTVDLIANGDFASGPGITCAGGSGKCVDLDGSQGSAGTMTSIAIDLQIGTYRLTYELAGVDDGFSQTNAGFPNTVDVTVQTSGGGPVAFTAQHELEKGDPFSLLGGVFSITAPTSVEIVFQNQGGDFFGAVLDNVALRSVPAPASPLLLLAGAVGLWHARSRDRALPGRNPA